VPRVQAEIGEQDGLVDVDRDALGAALGGDVLHLVQAGVPALRAEAQQVLGDVGDRPPRALLPRGVGRRVDDDLADDPPAGVARLAARDEELRDGVGDDLRPGLGAVLVEVAQRLGDAAAGGDGPGQLGGGAVAP
jgi:hypothetical protein